MNRTAQFELPLLLPSQAQKHVTVNEAITRLDAVAQLTIISDQMAPPLSASEGENYLVSNDATGVWRGKAGSIALWCNGGWIFLKPRTGWRAWDETLRAMRIFDGSEWLSDVAAFSKNGAATVFRVLEFDHNINPGLENVTAEVIPKNCQIFAVTGRVITPIVGSGITSWRLGVVGADSRFGNNLGIDRNSYVLGMLSAPMAYYDDTPMLISANGGDFHSGSIRIAIHILQSTVPRI